MERAIGQMREHGGEELDDATDALHERRLHRDSLAAAFTPIVRDLGITIDVSHISDTLDRIEGPIR